MIRGLLVKEWKDHGLSVAIIVLLLLSLVLLMSRVPEFSEHGGSTFLILSYVLAYGGPLVTLTLATMLIHSEYRNRTCYFLAALPIHRRTILFVKYFVGLGAVLLLTVVLLVGAWYSGRNAEAMTPNFLFLLFAKSAVWMWFCWSVCFAHSFLGRYRIATAFALLIALSAVHDAGVSIGRFGPFDLISDRLAYERYVWPLRAFLEASALIVAMTLAGLAIGTTKDSEVTEKLSKRMSATERVVVTVLIIGASMGVSMWSVQEPRGVPVNLPGAIDFIDRGACVSMTAAVRLTTKAEDEALLAHGESASELLARVAEYLQCEKLAKVNIVHRRDFKFGEFTTCSETESEVGLLRLNVVVTPPSDPHLQAKLIEHVLNVRQRGRVHSDARGWVLQGFAAWLPLRQQVNTVSEFMKLRGQRSGAIEESVSASDLRAWLKYESTHAATDLGTCAGIGVMVLGNGDETARRRFLTSVLGYEAPKDARASLHDWLNPVEPCLKATTGDDFETFAAKWSHEIKAIEVPQ